MKAFIFGAGASSGTVGAPVTDAFGRALNACNTRWRTEYPGLCKVVDYLRIPEDAWSLDTVWTCLDYYDKLQGIFGNDLPWSHHRMEVELSRALLDVYGESNDRAVDRLPLHDRYTLGELLTHEVQAGDRLISFNYDTTIERLASRFGLSLQAAHAGDGSSDLQLIKPHGSTSWSKDQSGGVTTHGPQGQVLLDALPSEAVCDAFQPILVGAVPFKSELIRQLQSQARTPRVHEVIVEQWKAIVRTLREAEEMVILGYSFPKEDCYGHFLVREALRQRRRPPRVAFYDAAENAERWIRMQQEAFAGMIQTPEYCGEVRPAA
jgi:hypothetical protein